MRDNIEILEKNEEIARKFQKIEENLPSFLNVKDLFEKLIIQIQEEFNIPFVWISIINERDLSSLVQALKSSQLLKDRLNIIDRSAFLNILTNGTKPVLANNYLKSFYKLQPLKKKYFIKSLAVAPITLNNEIIGSINHGDSSNHRYQPGMDTTLLEKLVSNISVHLSDIMTDPRQKTT
ncbi:MAG TPA: GAF domain-containing protein [Syntrophales bacterium]|nr:GAF domain-containing protein [Syntrophales bacterium]